MRSVTRSNTLRPRLSWHLGLKWVQSLERRQTLPQDHNDPAMSAPELRAAVRAVLEEFDEDVRASVVDVLIARATKAASGWRPTRPPQRIVEEAKSFAEAARHVGHADPDDVTEHLRRTTKAFLAGDHASARAVFEAILPPIASVDIDNWPRHRWSS